MHPFFSIIIPYHNNAKTIGLLLESIASSKKMPSLEVLIVDDASSDTLPKTSFGRGRPASTRGELAKLNFRNVRLPVNKGPAAARNNGAERARGKYLVFLDSDVELLPDALHNLWKIYRDDPDIMAVTGVWVKNQKTHAFFPNFKALRDWSYWINEQDKSGYYYLFSTRIASIKRTVFLRLGGFDERYTAPLIEDIEFTHRIARRYAIIFAPNVRVRHEFEGFWPVARKYFWRSFYYMKLYQTRKRFDPVATTLQEGVSALSGVGVLGLSVALIILWSASQMFKSQFLPSNQIPILHISLFLMLLYCFLTLLAVHLLLVRRFLVFVFREKGMVFAVRAFFTGLILSCFITAGALWGRMK